MNRDKVFLDGPMTEHDKQLVSQLGNYYWFSDCPFSEYDADTKEAYNIIHKDLVRKYHREEARNGDL